MRVAAIVVPFPNPQTGRLAQLALRAGSHTSSLQDSSVPLSFSFACCNVYFFFFSIFSTLLLLPFFPLLLSCLRQVGASRLSGWRARQSLASRMQVDRYHFSLHSFALAWAGPFLFFRTNRRLMKPFSATLHAKTLLAVFARLTTARPR